MRLDAMEISEVLAGLASVLGSPRPADPSSEPRCLGSFGPRVSPVPSTHFLTNRYQVDICSKDGDAATHEQPK